MSGNFFNNLEYVNSGSAGEVVQISKQPNPGEVTSTIFGRERTLVMGIVNVTPDSFSDGGDWFEADRAIAHGLELVAAGADIIDVGGESTRPQAVGIDVEEEVRRVLPVVKALSQSGVIISIDTIHSRTAQACISAGAKLVNDVSGSLADPQMGATIADLQCPYICQHWRGTPQTMDSLAVYGGDVTGEVLDEIDLRVQELVAAGVLAELIIIDPGLGFAKNPDQCWQILHQLDRVVAKGYPVLVGASRKRFLADMVAPDYSVAGASSCGERKDLGDNSRKIIPTGSDLSAQVAASYVKGHTIETKANLARRRDGATAAVSALAARAGVWAVRVHEVSANLEAIRVGQACREGGGGNG